MNKFKFNKNEEGALLIVGIVVMSILMILSAAVWETTMVQIKASKSSVSRAQLVNIAEGGIDKAVYQLNLSPSFTGESNVALGAGTFTTTVSNIDSTNKQITSTAYIPNSTNPTSQITIKMKVGINSNVVSFRYGVQAGTGGFSLTGGSTINGSVYSNGDIDATTGVHITGSAIAANPAALTADQTNDSPTPISSCTSSTCITFGNATATEDFAQSFKVSAATPAANVQFYIKKNGNPGNETVKVVADNSGSPSTTVLLSGTLSSSTVTTSFGWVTVTLPTNPVLDPTQTYWLVIDGSSNASNYYIIGANSAYVNGAAKIGRQSTSAWSNTTPSGLDGYFKLNLGGGYSLIGGNSYNTGVYVGTTSSDEAWGHTVMGATLTGPLVCQTSSYTNKSCDTSQGDPPSQGMPLSDNNIQDWKDDALAGGVQSGDVTVGFAGASIGPKHITGNLTINGGGTLTMTGTIWVDGNVIVSNGGRIVLSSTYGANSGALITDGYATVSGGGTFAGSGTTGSYPFIITTSACPVAAGCNGNSAMTLTGGAGTVAIVAQNGTASISGGSSLKSLVAKQIDMSGGATLNYDSGLINENFYSGPGGSYAPVPGSYIIIE